MGDHKTPGQCVRAFCTACVGGKSTDVRECQGDKCGNCTQGKVCLFFPFRMRTGRPSVRLLRAMCLECQGQSAQLVRECHETECVLFPWRFGKNPYISEETRELSRQRALAKGPDPFKKKVQKIEPGQEAAS